MKSDLPAVCEWCGGYRSRMPHNDHTGLCHRCIDELESGSLYFCWWCIRGMGHTHCKICKAWHADAETELCPRCSSTEDHYRRENSAIIGLLIALILIGGPLMYACIFGGSQ